MSMGKPLIFTIIGLTLIVINLTTFTVNERDLAIKLQVGEVVQSDYEPGLHFKLHLYKQSKNSQNESKLLMDAQSEFSLVSV